MSVRRSAPPTSNFLILLNEVAQDYRISARARGVLIDFLSRPADWTASAESIARQMGAVPAALTGVKTDPREGRDALRRAFEELRAAGYLITTKGRNPDGTWYTEHVIYDTPQNGTEAGNPRRIDRGGKPGVKQRTETKDTNNSATLRGLTIVEVEQPTSGDSSTVLEAAKEIARTVWRPIARGKSTQSETKVIAHIISSLENGINPAELSKAIETLVNAGEPVVDWRLGLAIQGKPREYKATPKGQLLADQPKDWSLIERDADGAAPF